MTVVSIPSLNLFDPAIMYHAAAQRFLEEHTSEITARSQTLSNELHGSMPEHAGSFDSAMQTLAQRFADEARFSQEAVTNLMSHYNFLAINEGVFSGTTPQPLGNLPIPSTSTWLQINNTALNGCFEELESKLREFAGDLSAFEQRTKDFENVIWIAVNQPDQLKFHVDVPIAGWEPDWLKAGIQGVTDAATTATQDAATLALRPAIDFIQAHQGEIYGMIDNMRQGFDKIFIPRTDPAVLQAHIDYLTALKSAYDTHIRSPFDTATRPIATQYHPPAGQESYQRAWPQIAQQQQATSMALGNIIGQLQQMQVLNEIITIATIAIVVAVGLFSLAVIVSAAIVTIVATLPTMIVSGGDVVISVGTVSINLTALAATLSGFLGAAFLGITVFDWGFIAPLLLVIGAGLIAEHEQLVQQSATSSSSASATSITWTLPGGASLPEEFRDLANRIYKIYSRLVRQGLLTTAAIAYLACHYSFDFIQQLLDNFALFAATLGPTGLSSTAINDVNGAIPMIHAIQIIGIANIAAINRPYTWLDAQGRPERNQQGNIITGDIDIVTNYGRPWYIEVGTENKISNPDFPNQLLHLKREAARVGAWPRFFVQTPEVPMTPNEEWQLQQTIETAVRVLDNGRPTVVTIDPISGVVTVDPPSNSVVVMPPLGC